MTTTITKLVIAGGGQLGLIYAGILHKLHSENFFNISNITECYASSIGAVICAFLCIIPDVDMVINYVVNRPWNRLFKIDVDKIYDFFNNKGVYDEHTMATMLSPFLKAKSLEDTITLKELYEHSKIDLHIFVSDIDNFLSLDLSHSTHPDLKLVTALTISCGLPGIVKVHTIDCVRCIDGGLLNNYPLIDCIRNSNKTDTDDILGINCVGIHSQSKDAIESAPLLVYFFTLAIHAMQSIDGKHKRPKINNELVVDYEAEYAFFTTMNGLMTDKIARLKFVDYGKDMAKEFLKNKATTPTTK